MQVTVSYRAQDQQVDRAHRIGALPGLRFVTRKEVHWDEPVLVVSRSGLLIRTDKRELRWHRGMLHTRLEAGWSHPLARAAHLEEGDQVLDGTLGMGTDAAFVAFLTQQPVVATEVVPALALMTAEGLRHHRDPVHVICGHSTSILAGCPSDHFDVVLGDPMFRPGSRSSPNLQLVRLLARFAPLEADWLAQARRVARRCVVMRDLPRGDLLERLGADEILDPGRKRPRYGTWWATQADGAVKDP